MRTRTSMLVAMTLAATACGDGPRKSKPVFVPVQQDGSTDLGTAGDLAPMLADVGPDMTRVDMRILVDVGADARPPADMAPDLPSAIDMTPDMAPPGDMGPDLTQTVDMAPDLPTTVDMAPDLPPTVDMAPDLPITVDMAPDLPTPVDTAPDLPPTVDMAPDLAPPDMNGNYGIVCPYTDLTPFSGPCDPVDNIGCGAGMACVVVAQLVGSDVIVSSGCRSDADRTLVEGAACGNGSPQRCAPTLQCINFDDTCHRLCFNDDAYGCAANQVCRRPSRDWGGLGFCDDDCNL